MVERNLGEFWAICLLGKKECSDLLMIATVVLAIA